MFGELNETMMRTRAYENGVFIAFVHVRGTLILDPRGNVAARSTPDDETLVYTVDLAAADAIRQQGRGHLTDHLRPDLYTRALVATR
jgi:predicted amidohydrolase